MSDHVNEDINLDGQGERGYDGTREPVRLEDLRHSASTAVVVGSLQQDGFIIRADSKGVLTVESIPTAQ